MGTHLTAFVVGLVFAVGLGTAHMTDPAKVLAFLDVAGKWDPSLALVMGGAIAIYLPVHRLVLRRTHPFLAEMFRIPQSLKIDRRLLVGSTLFGVGWGLTGICPGPALVRLSSGQPEALVFGIGLLAGMVLFHLWARPRAAPPTGG